MTPIVFLPADCLPFQMCLWYINVTSYCKSLVTRLPSTQRQSPSVCSLLNPIQTWVPS